MSINKNTILGWATLIMIIMADSPHRLDRPIG